LPQWHFIEIKIKSLKKFLSAPGSIEMSSFSCLTGTVGIFWIINLLKGSIAVCMWYSDYVYSFQILILSKSTAANQEKNVGKLEKVRKHTSAIKTGKMCE